LLVAVSLAVFVAACGGGSGKGYNIGEMGFMDAAKCAEYGGTYNAESILEACMVTKEECERAAGEWNAEMREGGVNDGIDFSCE
jgi:hypothetical protein